MSKYIDAVKTAEIVSERHKIPLSELVDTFAEVPTADVVEVVRCKDCTEWDKDEYECSHWYGFSEDDYCSLGARKDGGVKE